MIANVLAGLGVQAAFHKVLQRPGLPLWFGSREDGPVGFAVPGQGALTMALGSCGLGGDALIASDFAWLLAFIYVGSSLSRLRLAAGIIRLERKKWPDPLTPTGTALLTGVVAVALIQLLYVGSLYTLLPCTLWQGVGGDILIGQAPLVLAYAIVAALTNLIAMGADA